MGYSCIFSKHVDQLIHSIILFESKELQICCCLSSTCGSPSFMGFMSCHFYLLDLFCIVRRCNRKCDLLVPRQSAETDSECSHPHPASQQAFLDQCASDETGTLLHLGKRRPIKNTLQCSTSQWFPY